MAIRAGLQRVLAEYQGAAKEPFKGHPLANFLRGNFAQVVESVVANTERYLVTGSPGKGNWAAGPWVAVFDRTVTESAERGFYIVYLFAENAHGVYLSLNQGVTDVRKRYAVGFAEALRVGAQDIAARVGRYPTHFRPGPIDLAATKTLTKGYELGNALAVYYPADALPNDETIQADLRTMVDLYHRAVLSGGMAPVSTTDDDSDLPPEILELEEDLSAYREHKRVERDPKIARAVKRAKGYTCEVCDLNFEKLYGEIGRQFIEAHHLQPVSTVKGQVLRRNPVTDFAVLCSNCHRMIHRTGRPHDVAGLRAIVQRARQL